LDAATTTISVAVARRTLSIVATIEAKCVAPTNVVIVRRLAIVSAFAIDRWCRYSSGLLGMRLTTRSQTWGNTDPHRSQNWTLTEDII